MDFGLILGILQTRSSGKPGARSLRLMVPFAPGLRQVPDLPKTGGAERQIWLPGFYMLFYIYIYLFIYGVGKGFQANGERMIRQIGCKVNGWSTEP